MRIAIASGKGGTGKTTLATNLAFALAAAGERVAYLDCDVEEPNGHIFLAPEVRLRRQATIPVPQVDESSCTACGACMDACRYSAIVVLGQQVMTFPSLCHGCGACAIACSRSAIREVPRPIGVVEEGSAAGGVAFVQGRLDVGEAMATPLVRAVLEAAPEGHLTFVDAPPGTSCPVIESVRGADVVVLVAEPTPFGLNDLELAVEMVRALGLPVGVVVNRVGMGDRGVFAYCADEAIPVLLEVPDDRGIAEACSRGELVARSLPWLADGLVGLLGKLRALAGAPRTARPAPSSEAGPIPKVLPPFPSSAAGRDGCSGPPELVVISGKGGTGKTSIVASFFALAERAGVADCDVDAADLHLVLDPTLRQRWPFSGGQLARIDPAACTSCGACLDHCRFDAVVEPRHGQAPAYCVEPLACEGCGVCALVCPSDAVAMTPRASGEWFVSDTRYGPMTHAKLGVGQANSGKLVSLVRREARAVAAERECDLLLVDGSPGIGCPVIASVTGARLVLVVTEPSLSGLHDLGRVVELTRHFGIETVACINKLDINPELADRIGREAEAHGVPVLGRVRYDASVSRAQVLGVPVVELEASDAAADIRRLWERVRNATS